MNNSKNFYVWNTDKSNIVRRNVQMCHLKGVYFVQYPTSYAAWTGNVHFSWNYFISLIVCIFQKYLSSGCYSWTIMIKYSRKLCINKGFKMTTSQGRANISPILFHLNCRKYLKLLNCRKYVVNISKNCCYLSFRPWVILLVHGWGSWFKVLVNHYYSLSSFNPFSCHSVALLSHNALALREKKKKSFTHSHSRR